ncbi:MAG: hypothetical protein O2923_08705 [Verrucomicrobia bacterium]|nr:hypothetical protein [Verrucomicrobiota bacterium]MDA1087965.1 hypothetical protein [Verrucomicrobiota bacterium]
MKRTVIHAGCAVAVLAAATLTTLALSGCETESASELTVRVVPDAITILLDETVVFTASGGFEYAWSLADDSLGTLNTRTGSSVAYTSRDDPGPSNTTLQVLTVVSSVREFSGATNVTDDIFTVSADSHITHVGIIPPPISTSM